MLVKGEGIPWAFSFIPALLLTVGKQYKSVKLAILASLGALLLLVLAWKNPVVIAHFLRTVTEFHADGLTGTLQAVFLHDNLHLLGYVMMAAIALGLTIPGTFTKTYLGISVALACAVGMFLFLFLFTVFGAGASSFTGVARLCIQLAPGLLFLGAMLCNDILVRARMNRRQS
jgi:mannose/fructose/N-acetylgalactosamine-specific phosphotransferase system component IID